MATRSIPVILMLILLTAVVTRAEVSEQASSENQGHTVDKKEGNPDSGEKETHNTQKKQGVDITEFYTPGDPIWIVGGSRSLYLCMLDIVHWNDQSAANFTRYYHNEYRNERPILRSIDLVGKFRSLNSESQQGNSFNAMEVTSDPNLNQRGAVAGTWHSLEAMVYESKNEKCAIFSVKYYMRPSRALTATQKEVMQRVSGRDEYDIRMKNSILNEEAQQACLKELEVQKNTLEQNRQLPIPKTLQDCKKICEGNTYSYCSDDLKKHQ